MNWQTKGEYIRHTINPDDAEKGLRPKIANWHLWKPYIYLKYAIEKYHHANYKFDVIKTQVMHQLCYLSHKTKS